MNSGRFKSIQKKMKLTNKRMAEVLGVSQRAVDHWRAGTRPILGTVVRLLECLEAKRQAEKKVRDLWQK